MVSLILPVLLYGQNNGNIQFADEITKSLCVTSWDTNGDGELSYNEAAAVTSLGDVFRESTITSFDELQYFTGLTEIITQAFSNCMNLQTITLPSTITAIGQGAFVMCDNLQVIDIPASVANIGDGAFWECMKLAEIRCHVINPFPIQEQVFFQPTYEKATLHVPQGSGQLYRNTEFWSKFANIIDDLTEQNQSDPEPYAVLSNNNTVLTFYYDNQKASRNGMGVGPFNFDEDIYPEWFGESSNITDVIIDTSFANCTTITSTAYWFCGCDHLTSITGINNLKTNNITDMSGMFVGCSSLTNLDVSGFITNNVSDMHLMFSTCSSLTSLNVRNFKTDIVTDMSNMFVGCSSLTNLDVTHFNTQNVTNMNGMFWGCSGLTSLDLSNFNTANVNNMQHLFNECLGLATIYVGNGWSTTQFTIGDPMFEGCTNLVGGAGTRYSEDHIGIAYAHIDGGTANPGYFTAAGAEPWTEPNEPEPYAVLSSNNTVLTFYYDENKATRNGMDVGPFEDLGKEINSGWYGVNEQITTVVFDNSFANCTTLTSTAYWFYQCENLTTITGISNLKTDNVTDINSMFADCHSLKSIDLSSLNFSKVTNMHQVFEDCRTLESVNFTGVNTENVTIMGDLFLNCHNLRSIDLSSFNTSKVTNMEYMFYRCDSLTTIYVGDGWSTANVTESRRMFEDCTNLVGGAGTHFDENHIDAAYAHIDGGAANPGYLTAAGAEPWTEADVEPYAVYENSTLTFYYDNKKEERGGWRLMPVDSNREWREYAEDITTVIFDPSFSSCRPTNTSFWFFGFTNLTSIVGIENLNTSNVNNMAQMFTSCSSLTNLVVSGFNTDYVTNMSAMFADCRSLTSLDVSGFNTEKVTNMSGLFERCSSLTNLDLSHFDTHNVTEMVQMFFECSGLTNLDVSNFNTENVKEFYLMFAACRSLTSLDVSSFNTASATEIDRMFSQCSGLTTLDLHNFNTDNVTNMNDMFFECSNLKSINISNFNTSKVPNYNFNSMFAGCSSLASIQAGSANIPAEEYARIGNPNLLVYVNDASLAPEGVQNIVINGQAQEIILTDAATGNNNWYCPQAFTAEKISYARNFGQQTEVGVSRGWESIALPFTVQEITHESKGQITPFGANGNKHFWLRGYSPDGLYSATTLEANKPYVTSMPNNTVVYPDAYNLNGRITFSASNTTVPATPPLEEMMVVRDNIIMMPTFQYIPQNEYVYAVNVGQARDRYAEGSVFARDLRDVRPFEAYTTHGERNGARPNFIRIAAQPSNESVGIRDIKTDSAEGAWYSIDGRKLQGEPQRKGVYIQKGKKVVR